MNMTIVKHISFTIVLACTSFNAFADWNLNNAESTLNFISIKKLKAGEVHSFKKLQGSLSDEGDVSLTVALASVETNIPIRNDRIQQVFFEIPKFAEASASTKIVPKLIDEMKMGDSFSQQLPLNLSIHGFQQIVKADMRITRLAGDKLLVSTIKPIIINAGNYDLVKGVEKLKELAKLPSISTVFPVTASFIFEKKQAVK